MRRLLNRLLALFGLRLEKAHKAVQRDQTAPPVEGLSPALLENTVIDRSHDESGLPGDELFRIFDASTDTHKWHHYFPVYSSLFQCYRDRPVRMLEIGVHDGGSLNMWAQWFHPDSSIVGIDIDPDCARFDRPQQNLHVRIGDQTDGDFLASVSAEFGPFDIILDDGGHTTAQMITSFNCLFREALRDGGLYLVEDVHTNYIETFIDSDITFIEMCKQLVDLLHEHYVIAGSPGRFRIDEGEVITSLDVPYATAWIKSIAFYDSIVAISKERRPLPSNDCRY